MFDLGFLSCFCGRWKGNFLTFLKVTLLLMPYTACQTLIPLPFWGDTLIIYLHFKHVSFQHQTGHTAVGQKTLRNRVEGQGVVLKPQNLYLLKSKI